MNNLTAKQIEQLNDLNVNTQQMVFGAKIQEIISVLKKRNG